MFNLAKYEIEYHRVRYLCIILLPFIYVMLTYLHSGFNFEQEVYVRILFPILFGMLPIILIAVSWTISLKEYRLRSFKLLPVSQNKIALIKFFVAFVPVMLLVIIDLTILISLKSEWTPITDRIIYQHGTITHLIATLYLSFELVNFLNPKGDITKLLIAIPVFVVNIAFIFYIDNELWYKVHQYNIGMFYTLTGLLIFAIGRFLFLKRKSYLA